MTDSLTVADLIAASKAVNEPPTTNDVALAAKFRELAEALRRAGPGAKIGIVKEID